jgi:hypothetical protein
VVIHDSNWHAPCASEGVYEVAGHDALTFLYTNKPALLVVDVRPLGSGGELVTYLDIANVKKVYVHRHMKVSPTADELATFDRVLFAEEHLEGIEGIDVCPILIRNPKDLPRASGPVIERPAVPDHYPFMEQIALASGVKSPASYNTFWEAKALDVPGEWTTTEQETDDHAWRVATFGDINGSLTNQAETAALVIRELIEG